MAPTGIDLHDPEIVGAVAIPVYCPWLAVGLDPGNGLQYQGIDAVRSSGLFKAELLPVRSCCHGKQHDDAECLDIKHGLSRTLICLQQSQQYCTITEKDTGKST